MPLAAPCCLRCNPALCYSGRVVTLQEFKASAAKGNPTEGLSPELVALWHDFKQDWHGAHQIAQDIHTPIGSRIHAYLHRKEGDLGNARYWYRRASEPEFPGTLEEEWVEIAGTLLENAEPGTKG